jgi:hypothetical protein
MTPEEYEILKEQERLKQEKATAKDPAGFDRIHNDAFKDLETTHGVGNVTVTPDPGEFEKLRADTIRQLIEANIGPPPRVDVQKSDEEMLRELDPKFDKRK